MSGLTKTLKQRRPRRELSEETMRRDVDARLPGRLEHVGALGDGDGVAVDLEGDEVAHGRWLP